MKPNKRKRAENGAGTLVWHGKSWQARWKVDGKIISRSTGTDDINKAREWLATHSAPRIGMRDRAAVAKLARAISASLDDADTRRRTIGIPLAHLFEIWRDSPDRRDVAEVTLDGYRQQLEGLASWTKRRYPEITSARDVSQTVADEFVKERAASVSASRVNRDLNLFAMVWRTLSRRYGLEYNPWSSDHIARRRHTPVERRALTDEEVNALLANSTGEIHLMIRLGISTGLRLGDIVNLSWANVDMDRREIAIRRTRKTGAPVVLPMVKELYDELLGPFSDREDEWVLPWTHSRAVPEICHSIARVFRRAGIEMRPDGTKTPTASFHSLRHTFVTRLMRRGISPALIQAAVGHSTMMMTEHYTHISAEDLARGLASNK
jgi:integrase